MKKVDFLFVYEAKNRELENICLIANELEKRGYTVAFTETWHSLHYAHRMYDAKVVISFAMYGTEQGYMLSYYSGHVTKLLNMQWEQLYSISDEENDSSTYHFTGNALKAVHVSWGKYNYDKLANRFGIPQKNICMSGQITFDFLKPRLKYYYYTREDLFSKYKIDGSRQVCLFISSFSYNELPDSLIDGGTYQNLAYDPNQFKRISIQSQKILFDWLKEVLPKHPEIVFIYRPHPAEIGNARLFDLEKQLTNFKVIRDESVKQWILVCDKIYSWYSTAIAEAYGAEKEYELIRPIPIPRDYDMRIFEGCSCIDNMQSFEESFHGSHVTAINEELMHEYYYLSGQYAYVVIADKLEDMLKDDSYQYDFLEGRHYGRSYPYNAVKMAFKRFLVNHVYKKGLAKPKESMKTFTDEYDFTEHMIQNNYSTDADIQKIRTRIKNALERTEKE